VIGEGIEMIPTDLHPIVTMVETISIIITLHPQENMKIIEKEEEKTIRTSNTQVDSNGSPWSVFISSFHVFLLYTLYQTQHIVHIAIY